MEETNQVKQMHDSRLNADGHRRDGRACGRDLDAGIDVLPNGCFTAHALAIRAFVQSAAGAIRLTELRQITMANERASKPGKRVPWPWNAGPVRQPQRVRLGLIEA